ncbi:MAG: hypothetical protein IJC67_06495, partial [Clostridia bacterium]|nr:hypothetical protein [Clostridia bacterium]
MAQKKYFWQKLFSSDKEEKQIACVDGKSIQESLKSEYGLTIQEDNIAVEALTKQHYRKVTGKELSHVNQVFQYIPQILANN